MAQYRGVYRVSGNPGDSNGFEDSLDHFSRQGSGSIPQRQRSQKGYEVPPPGPDIIENEIMRQSNRRGSNKQMKCTRNSDCQCPNCKAAMSSLYASPAPPAPQRPDLMEETDHIRFGARAHKERGGSASRAGLALLKSKMNKHPSFRDEEYNSLPPSQYNSMPMQQQQRKTQSQHNYQRQTPVEVDYEVEEEEKDNTAYPQYQRPKQIPNRRTQQPPTNNRYYQSNSSGYNDEGEEDNGDYNDEEGEVYRQPKSIPQYHQKPQRQPQVRSAPQPQPQPQQYQQPPQYQQRPPQQQQQQQQQQRSRQQQQLPPQQPQYQQQPRRNGPRVECTRKAGCQCPDCLNAMGALSQPANSFAPIVDPTANMILQPCPICGRSFSDDVLPKHIQACQKASKKRKTFNSTNSRVKAVVELNGQDAAQIVKAALKKKEVQKKKPAMPKWKIQSEQFRAAMRSTKGDSGKGNGGGGGGGYDGSKYETPPDIDDRVPCPHCGRKFEAQVAERHIPKCKDIIAKPKTTHRNTGVGAGAAGARMMTKKPTVNTRRH